MSCRVDTAPLLSGCCVVSLFDGHGVRGDAIPSTGAYGPAPLYTWLTLPGDAANEYRWGVTVAPTVGTLEVFEDGSYIYTPPPATVDLLESFDFDAWENGTLLGSATYTITIGSPGGSVITAAVGVSTASTIVGKSTVAATITAAAGVATASTMTGIAGTGSAIGTVAGVATASTMAGASTAASAITSATGAATASVLAGASTVAAGITAAAGVATASTLTGTMAGDGSAISPATGVASAQILVGASFARAVIGAASGAATCATLNSSGGVVVLSAPPIGHGQDMSRRTKPAGRSRPANLSTRTR